MSKNKRSIPKIRMRLKELAKEHGIKELNDLAEELFRSPAVKRASVKSAKLTPELAEKIRLFKKKNPDMHQAEIAHHFDVNPGRVSEALNNLV